MRIRATVTIMMDGQMDGMLVTLERVKNVGMISFVRRAKRIQDVRKRKCSERSK